jgi:putative hydrolase of the HAD superfamily
VNIWIYTDADNTLWDTDAVFAQAQLALLDAAEQVTGRQARAAERLAFVRQFDQAIAARHHQRLRYPPALLVRALSDGIKGSAPDDAAQRTLAKGAIATEVEAEGLRVYAETLSSVPPLLAGVQSGLKMAHDHQIDQRGTARTSSRAVAGTRP